jgi:hypothetical protein
MTPLDPQIERSPTGERLGTGEEHSASAAGHCWRWHCGLVTLLLALSLAPVWISPRFPSQNGPWYLLLVHMTDQIENPLWNYAEYYHLSVRFVPHMLHESLVFGLYQVFPLLVAEKVALSIYVVLLPLSVFYLLWAVAPQGIVFGYFSFLMVHSFSFYRGYHDYCLSIPFFFLAFALWHRNRERFRFRHFLLVGLLSALAYLGHLITFALLVGTIGLFRLRETGSLGAAVRSVLGATWIGWLLMIDFVTVVLRHPGGFTPEDSSFLPVHTVLENFVRNMFYSSSFPAYVIATVPWLVIALVLVAGLLRAVRRSRGIRGVAVEPLALVVAALLCVYLLSPYKLLGWHRVNVRVIPFVLGMALCGAARYAPDWWRRSSFRTPVLTSVCCAAVAVYLLLARDVMQMNRDVDEYTAGIDYFPGNMQLLPIHLQNDPHGQIRPVTRAHEYYHIARGGANGRSVARFKHLTTLWYRRPFEDQFPEYDAKNEHQSMHAIAEAYGCVLLWGMDQAWERRLEDAGFQCRFREKRLAVYIKAPDTAVAHKSH